MGVKGSHNYVVSALARVWSNLDATKLVVDIYWDHIDHIKAPIFFLVKLKKQNKIIDSSIENVKWCEAILQDRRPTSQCQNVRPYWNLKKIISYYVLYWNLIISKENSVKVVWGSRVGHRLELGRSVWKKYNEIRNRFGNQIDSYSIHPLDYVDLVMMTLDYVLITY